MRWIDKLSPKELLELHKSVVYDHRPHREILPFQSALQRMRFPEQRNQGRAHPSMGLPEMRDASRSRPQRGEEHPRRRAAHPFRRKGNSLKYKLGGASSSNRSFRKSLARGQEALVTLESHGFSRGSMSTYEDGTPSYIPTNYRYYDFDYEDCDTNGELNNGAYRTWLAKRFGKEYIKDMLRKKLGVNIEVLKELELEVKEGPQCGR